MPIDELKPCPFCGGEATLCATGSVRQKRGWYPTCETENCPGVTQEQDEQGGTHFDYWTKAEAVAAWNTRAPIFEAALRPMVCPVCKGSDPDCQWGGVPANCSMWVKDYALRPKLPDDLAGLVERFGEDVQDVQSRIIIAHQLRASADIQDKQTKAETGWADTSDRAQLMRRAADKIEQAAQAILALQAEVDRMASIIQRMLDGRKGARDDARAARASKEY